MSSTTTSPPSKKASILATTVNLLGNRPFSEVTSKRIAKEAGVSEGLIFKYHGSLNTLYETVITEKLSSFFAIEIHDPSETNRLFLIQAITAILNKLLNNHKTWHIYTEALYHYPNLLDTNHLHLKDSPVFKAIESCLIQELGDNDTALSFLLDFIEGTIVHFVGNSYNNGRSFQAQGVAALLVTTIYNGLLK